MGLSRARRLVNLKNAFKVSCAEKISETKRILIVDDVSTTGTTVSEAAKAVVRKAGAVYVAVMVVALEARTIRRNRTSELNGFEMCEEWWLL